MGEMDGPWHWYSRGTIASGIGSPGMNVHFAYLDGYRRSDYLEVDP